LRAGQIYGAVSVAQKEYCAAAIRTPYANKKGMHNFGPENVEYH